MPVVALVIAVVALGLLTAETWLWIHCRDQQRRIADRLANLAALKPAARAAAGPAPAHVVAPVAGPNPTPLAPVVDIEPAVPAPVAPVGEVEPDEPRPLAPAFVLPSLAGTVVTRDRMLATGRPALIVITDDERDPHQELVPDLARWQHRLGDQLTVLLVTSGPAADTLAVARDCRFAPARVLRGDETFAVAMGLKPERRVPAMLRLAPDGTREGSLLQGIFSIRREVEKLGEEMAAASPRPAPTPDPIRPLAPRFRRPGVAGGVVDLADAEGRPTILLFLNPGCRHSGQMLPAIKEWSEHTDGPRLIVIGRGPADLTHDPGIVAPVVRDDDRYLARLFGVESTPTAVVVDGEGHLAHRPYEGALAVSLLAARAWGTFAAVAD